MDVKSIAYGDLGVRVLPNVLAEVGNQFTGILPRLNGI